MNTKYTLVSLPASLDLERLGLAPSEVSSVSLLQARHGHALYRLTADTRSFVLKWFSDPGTSIEVRAYTLLQQYGVPTLPVHGRTNNALLLEDLAISSEWRLAVEGDMGLVGTGVAVAAWYKAFHAAGFRLLSDPERQPITASLHREVEVLDAPGLLLLGARLKLADNPVWRLAAEHIEALKEATRALPTTLNYNDFSWTNLALSRPAVSKMRAALFDYHLLGIGPVYSDYRNVCFSLRGDAREAFEGAYGPPNEHEGILDAPISVLYSLYIAAQRPSLPRWAVSLLGEVTSGDLEEKLRRGFATL